MVKKVIPSTRLRAGKQVRNKNADALQRSLNQRDRELGILLEDVNGKFDIIAEGHQSLTRQFAEFSDEMIVFRDQTLHSLAEIRSELRSIRGEIESLRRILTQKADLNRLEELERRVRVLEHASTRPTKK